MFYIFSIFWLDAVSGGNNLHTDNSINIKYK